jgi:hypothetical protein
MSSENTKKYTIYKVSSPKTGYYLYKSSSSLHKAYEIKRYINSQAKTVKDKRYKLLFNEEDRKIEIITNLSNSNESSIDRYINSLIGDVGLQPANSKCLNYETVKYRIPTAEDIKEQIIQQNSINEQVEELAGKIDQEEQKIAEENYNKILEQNVPNISEINKINDDDCFIYLVKLKKENKISWKPGRTTEYDKRMKYYEFYGYNVTKLDKRNVKRHYLPYYEKQILDLFRKNKKYEIDHGHEYLKFKNEDINEDQQKKEIIYDFVKYFNKIDNLIKNKTFISCIDKIQQNNEKLTKCFDMSILENNKNLYEQILLLFNNINNNNSDDENITKLRSICDKYHIRYDNINDDIAQLKMKLSDYHHNPTSSSHTPLNQEEIETVFNN